MLIRTGATLVELLVAMTLAAVILGAAGSTLVRQRRESDAAASRSGAESQVRAALAEVPAALAGLSPAAGDLAVGEARDTALQIRAVVIQGVACDSAVGQVTFSAADTGADRETAVVAAPRAGDTLWWWRPGAASWTARRVALVTSGNGACARRGGTSRPLLRLGFPASDTVPMAAPVRLTRQVRLSFYHAGDGSWQLGIAEWSELLRGFAAPQPVAGPFVLTSPAGERTGFRYFDASGGELRANDAGVPVGGIARLRLTVVAPASGRSAAPSVLRDSVDVAVGHVP